MNCSKKSVLTPEFMALAKPDLFELTPLQQSYYTGSRADFDFHVSPHLYLEFDQDHFEPAAMNRALAELHARHFALRSYIHSDGRLGVANTPLNTGFVHNDFSNLNEAELQSQLQEQREQGIRYDFDLKNPGAMVVRVSTCATFYRVHISLSLLLLDGYSLRLVLDDLSQLYHTGRSNIPVPDVGMQDIQCWREKMRSSERYQRCLESWRNRLESFSEAPVLPLKHYKHGPHRSKLVRRKHIVDADRWVRFSEHCTEYGLFATSALLGLYAKAVSYWCKYPSFYLSMLVRGQERKELEAATLVGNFVKVALIEVDFSEPLTVLEMLKRLNSRVRRDMARSQVCGVELLQEKNRNQRATARAASPIAFASMLTDQPVNDATFQLESSRQVFSSLETPQVLLDHQPYSRPDGGVTLVLDAMDEAFEPGITEDIFNRYVFLVEALISDEANWHRTYFDFRKPAEAVAHSRYNTETAPLPDKLLHELLPEQCKRMPDAPLVIDASGQYSYADINGHANQLAWLLREQYSIGPNDLVAVSLPKGWRQVVAIQAILSAGGAYVPLMPSWPLQRKLNVLERCQCTLVISVDEGSDDFAGLNLKVISVDEPERCNYPLSAPPTVQKADDIAYVLFTSGSTGTPKGVVLDHAGPANTIQDINRRFSVTPSDRVLGLSDLSFDLSVYDLFGTIAAGAALVLPEEGDQQNPAKCLKLVQENGVTLWNSVPALMQLFVEYLEMTSFNACLPLKTIMMSGDWIPVTLPERLARFSSASVFSLGGATEASIWSIYFPVNQVPEHWASIPYGYPLANQKMYILDANLQQRPDNVPGEIYIGGIGLAKGYWDDLEKTRHAFITHPETGERLYRTGDWGVRRRQGFIEFLGREDGQVKVRGFRIELGEIEAVLKRDQTIDDAIVKVEGGNSQTAHIVAYVATRNKHITASGLHQVLADHLPGYMVPARIEVLSHMPLTPTGKVDRKALSSLHSGTDKYATGEVHPPESETEKRLAGFWRELLNVKAVFKQSDFFDLGGTSFSAVRLTVLLNDAFGVDLSLSDLLRHSELATLAAEIDAAEARRSEKLAPTPLSTGPDDGNIFWFHPSGGNVVCYREVARRLSGVTGSYGIEAEKPSRSLADSVTDTTVEQLAREYIGRIKIAQPSGPYRLAGWSFGGVLAFEAARQLLAAGEKVETLLLIDSPIIGTAAEPVMSEPTEAQLAQWFVGDLCEVDRPDLYNSVTNVRDTGGDPLTKAVGVAKGAGLMSDAENLPLDDLFASFKRNLLALHRYRPEPVFGMENVLVLMASEQVEARVPRLSSQRWSELLPDHSIIKTLQGNHYSLLKAPIAAQLCEWVESSIEGLSSVDAYSMK